METFLRLPFLLCTDLLSRWLTFRDWSLLDRCYAGGQDRHDWLALLQQDVLIMEFPCTNASDPFMEWCSQRRVNVNRMVIRGSGNDHETVEQFVRTCCRFSSELYVYDEESLQRVSLYAQMSHARFKSVCLNNCESLRGLDVLLQQVAETIKHLFINGIAGDDVPSMKFDSMDLPQLTRLELHDITGASTAVLARLIPRCTSLGRATFVDVEFHRKLAPALARVGKTLHTLTFISCGNLTNPELEMLSRSCHSLETFILFDVRGVSALNDRTVASVTANCTRLTTLQLSAAAGMFSGASLEHIAMNCGNRLLYLHLHGITGDYSDVGTLTLARYCTNLRALYWMYNSVPDDAVCTLFRSLPRLQQLQCGALTGAMVQCLADCCPDLTYLSTYGSKDPSFTLEALAQLLRRCASLRKLILADQVLCAAARREAARQGMTQLVLSAWTDEGCPSLAFSV